MAIIPVQEIDLNPEIEDWKDAVCGQEVRAANVRAFQKIQTSVNATVQNVNDAAAEVEKAAENAQKAVEDANSSINTANKAVSEAASSATKAAESASKAETEADTAAQEAVNAKNQADRAEQFANMIMPDFILQDNRVYINSDSTIDFTIYNNKMYFKTA